MRLPGELLVILIAAAAGLAASPAAAQNLAPSGTAYRWAHNSSAASNANRAPAPRLNDGSLARDVDLSGGSGEARAAYQAAGVVWPAPRTFGQLAFVNGTWQSSGDGAFCADLRLQASPDGTTWVDIAWTVTPTYAHGPGAAGVTYRFNGAAITARGVRIVGRLRCSTQASYWANVRELQAFAAGPDRSPPTAPSSLTAVATQAQRVDLAWAASMDDVGVASYQVFRNGAALANAPGTRHADLTVAAGTVYSYQVRALDAAGNASALSNTAAVNTPPADGADRTPPSVPADLGAVADGAGAVALSWNASTDNVGVARYQVVRDGTVAPIGEPVGTRFTDTTVVPGTTATYRVRALDAAGNASAFSAPASATPGIAPTRQGWLLTAGNVGLAAHGLVCDALPLYQGSAKPAAGTVIRQQRVTVPLDLSNGHILIERSCIRPASVGSHHAYLVTTTTCDGSGCQAPAVGDVVIRDSEIDGSALPAQAIAPSCAFLGVGTLERNYMHGMGSGICFFETGTTHSARAVQNYVRGLRSWGDPAQPGGSHNEAATIRDFRDAPGRRAEFINNRLDCSGGNETGALFIQPTWLPIHNVFIEGNLFEGGGFNLYLERTGNASYGNVNAVNNRFRPTGWGPAATPSGPGYTTWRDNHLYDAQAPDSRGAPVSP